MNTEMRGYIEAVARLNETIDSDDKFVFCHAYYNAKNKKQKDKLTPNPETYGYKPTGAENALGLSVPEGFILYDFDEPSDKFKEYYKKTWGHTGLKPEGCGHLLFRCKTPHRLMTNAKLTIFGSQVELCRKKYRPAFTPGSRKIKGRDITHHWNKIETVLDEPVELLGERVRAMEKVKDIPSTPPNQTKMETTTAGEIALALKGRKTDAGWMAHCPAHDDKNPSLFIRQGHSRPLFYCHTGCPEYAVLEALQVRGLWVATLTPDEKRAAAMEIWEESKPAENTLAETYLKSLGWNSAIPSSIRFHPNLQHKDGDHFPGVVSLITHSESQTPMAIHRTFLDRDGKGMASIEPARMRLGSFSGGVIRLGEPDKTLMIGREIEKCISSMQERNLPAWCYSSATTKELVFPPGVKEVMLLNDYDKRSMWTKRNFIRQATRQGFRATVEDANIDPEKIKVRKG